MKLIYTALFLPLMVCANAQAQQLPGPCGTVQAIHYQEALTPGYEAQVSAAFDQAKSWKYENHEKSGAVYTIPVVVHVVYNTPAQNISDAVIIDQIAVLNEDYNRLNADTINMRSDFDPVKGSPKIEFMLAHIDPMGNPTNGITRTQTSTTSFGSLSLFLGDFSDLEKVKSTADGGMDAWDPEHYLNIWVTNMAVSFGGQEMPALLGYATPPDGLPNWPQGSTAGLGDGVVIQFQAFGRNNPNTLDAGNGPVEVRGRTTTHEVGHYLGLRHIWGDGDCTQQDGIDDTPNAEDQSQFDCDDTKNTCVDNIGGVDLPDMIENYMDYSAETCQNSFTQGQVDLMHGVLENERYELVHGNPAGIKENTLDAVSVYPNPSEATFRIQLPEGMHCKMQIHDITGNLINELGRIDATTVIDVASYNTGIYLITLSADMTDTKTMRFTKL